MNTEKLNTLKAFVEADYNYGDDTNPLDVVDIIEVDQAFIDELHGKDRYPKTPEPGDFFVSDEQVGIVYRVENGIVEPIWSNQGYL